MQETNYLQLQSTRSELSRWERDGPRVEGYCKKRLGVGANPAQEGLGILVQEPLVKSLAGVKYVLWQPAAALLANGVGRTGGRKPGSLRRLLQKKPWWPPMWEKLTEMAGVRDGEGVNKISRMGLEGVREKEVNRNTALESQRHLCPK